MAMRIEGQGHLCGCMHWDSLHGPGGCTRCMCPSFTSRRGAEPDESAAGASQAAKEPSMPAYCYHCGQNIEWANDRWRHVPRTMHDIRPVYDQVDMGQCGDCGKAIHRTAEGILRHSNGPHADHGHAPRIWAGAPQADQMDVAREESIQQISRVFDVPATLLREDKDDHLFKAGMYVAHCSKCGKPEHLHKWVSATIEPVEPCCQCNGSVTASIGCECRCHDPLLCTKCGEPVSQYRDGNLDYYHLTMPEPYHAATIELLPFDGQTNTGLQSEDVPDDTLRDGGTDYPRIPSVAPWDGEDYIPVNLTNVQECKDCGCLILNPAKHVCMATARPRSV